MSKWIRFHTSVIAASFLACSLFLAPSLAQAKTATKSKDKTAQVQHAKSKAAKAGKTANNKQEARAGKTA